MSGHGDLSCRGCAELASPGCGGRDLVEQQKIFAPCNQCRGATDFIGRHAIDFGDFADRCAQPQGVLVGHHGGLLAAIGLEHPIYDVVPLIPGKVDVDVGRIFAAGIEKALEK